MYICFMGRNSHIPAADTEQFIIEKAAELFNKKGFWGTSLSDLEKATGLTKGSIYSNFKDKEEVFLKVFDFNHKRLLEGLVARVKTQRSERERLLASIDFYIDYFPTMKANGGCAIQNALVEADDTNQALFKKAKTALKNWTDNTRDILLTGIRNGEFKTELNAEQFATYFVATIEGAILVAKSLDSHDTFKAILNRLKTEIEML